jgi:hypothetical protein
MLFPSVIPSTNVRSGIQRVYIVIQGVTSVGQRLSVRSITILATMPSRDAVFLVSPETT